MSVGPYFAEFPLPVSELRSFSCVNENVRICSRVPRYSPEPGAAAARPSPEDFWSELAYIGLT